MINTPPGFTGEIGPPGEPGEEGAIGLPGVNGNPGVQGQEGPRGKRGRGSVEVFVLHSFNSTIPQCPGTAHTLWEGFSAGRNRDDSHLVKASPLSSPSSCQRRFSLLRTLYDLRHNISTASSWFVAGDIPGVQDRKTVDAPTAEKFVARCSVCEMEAEVLAVHSGITALPPCPEAWDSVWTGFTYLTGMVSY